MKEVIFLLMGAGCSVSAIAQQINKADYSASMSPGWAIDVNLMGGLANQTFKTANTAGNYPNAINSNQGQLKYHNGYSYGANLQLGYFFGKGRNFGIGSGIMLTEQRGEMVLTGFHQDYRSRDAAGNVFRQVLTGNDVREDIVSSMVNVPIMLKYKARFSKRWGFSADAGALINLQTNNAYTTHATFDQGSIYKFVQNADGGTTAIFDDAVTPAPSDWLITKEQFLRNNPDGNWAEYARIKRSMGINVGDKLVTGSRTGKTSYTTGGLGFLVQPSINFYLSNNLALNLGGYFMYQEFKNDAQAGYRLTDGNGSYSSVLNNVTASTNTAYGVNLGARFMFGGKAKDRDKDGVPDKKDLCPDVFGLAVFQGCPDTDRDSIPDAKDSCVFVFGLAKFNGCPDTDGDGIPDKQDECPYAAGPIELKGCPDRDNDGIADKDDLCPDVFGLAIYKGCPDTDGDGIPDNLDKCPLVAGTMSNNGCPIPKEEPKADTRINTGDMNTPILFEVNKAQLKDESMPVIEDAVNELNKHNNSVIVVEGHADASGPAGANEVLSLKRANSVKEELTQRGISPKRVKTVGYGSRRPEATNSTYEGKQKNRNAQMKLKMGK